MNKTKKSLLFSGLALMMSALLLVGTTFAWFTDSVTNKGNVITSGNLSIEAVAYDVDTAKDTYTIPGVNNGNAFGFKDQGTNLKGENVPAIINEKLWEPGVSNAKLLTVTNTGSLATNVQVKFDVKDGGLMNALWFDFINVENGQFTKRPMSQLAALGDATTVTLEAKESVSFILVYGMNEEAGNEYQGKDFSADVKIIATQAPVEEDGFGNPNYDKDATFPVTNNKSFVESLENGGVVTATGAFDWDTVAEMKGDTKSTLNLADDANITVTKDGILDLKDNAEVIIQGKGALNQDMESEIGYLIRAAGSSKVIIKDGVFVGGLTCVQAGDNAQVEIYGGHFEALVDWGGNYWLLNLIDNSEASIKVYGGTFVNYDPSNSKTESPVANFVADGYKVVSEEKDNGDIWYTVVPEN